MAVTASQRQAGAPVSFLSLSLSLRLLNVCLAARGPCLSAPPSPALYPGPGRMAASRGPLALAAGPGQLSVAPVRVGARSRLRLLASPSPSPSRRCCFTALLSQSAHDMVICALQSRYLRIH